MGSKLSQYNLEVPADGGVYWYNTFTGASVLLADAELAFLKRVVTGEAEADSAGAWAQVTDFVARHGFIVPLEADELSLAMAKYDRTVADRSALALVIAPSLKCNMKCYYCYEGDKPEEALHAEDADALVAFIESRLADGGTLGITWFGGEPLLSKPFILDVSRRLQETCARRQVAYGFRMVSNGYLLDAATAADLAHSGISSVQVTFDGSRQAHDRVRRSSLGRAPAKPSFDRIVANIAAAAEHLDVLVRVNVSKFNLDTLPTLIRELSEAGLPGRVAGLYFYPVFNFKPADDDANYLPKKSIHFSMEEFAAAERGLVDLALAHGFELFVPRFFEAGFLGCYASIENGFVVDYQGNLRKCDHELGLPAEGLNTIHDYSRLEHDPSLLKWRAQRPETNRSCRDCVFLPICYAHCPHSNLVLPDREPHCPSYKYNWRELFPLYLGRRSRSPADAEPAAA